MAKSHDDRYDHSEKSALEDFQEQVKQAENDKQNRQTAALELLKQDPNFPGIIVQIHKQKLRIERSRNAKADRLSESLFRYCIRHLDSVACAYLRLVTSIKTHEAFYTVLQEQASRAWMRFSGIPIEGIQPTPDFYGGPIPPILAFRDRFVKRVEHWFVEGFKQISSQNPTQSETTSSMSAKEVVPPGAPRCRLEPKPEILRSKETVNRQQAAAALGISERTLDRWIADGQVTPFQAGKRKRFKSKDSLRVLGEKQTDRI